MNLDASTLEPARRVLPKLAGDLGEDLRRRVHEHPALWHVAKLAVGAERRMCHVVQLGKRFDPAYPAPTNTKPSSAESSGWIEARSSCSRTRLRSAIVLNEILEADPMLREPRAREACASSLPGR